MIDHIIRHSQILVRLLRRIAHVAEGKIGEKQALRNDFDSRGPDVRRTNFRLFCTTSELLGVRLFVVKQATLIVPDLSAEQRARCQYSFHRMDHETHLRAFAGIYRVIEEEMPPHQVIDLTRLSVQPDLFTITFIPRWPARWHLLA